MQNLSKLKRHHVRFIVSLSIFLGTAGMGHSSFAQLETIKYLDYLQQAKSITNNHVLAYSYRVVMQDIKTRKVLDSTAGRIYKSGEAYLDSNRFAISVVNGGYFFKGDYRRKEAYVYKLATVEKKLGLQREDMSNSVLDIPDSLILRMGRLSVQEYGESLVLKYTLKENRGSFQEIQFRLKKSDRSLQEIRMTAPGNEVNTFYYLSDFTNAFDLPRLRMDKYFRIENGKVKLKGKYQSYQLTELL